MTTVALCTWNAGNGSRRDLDGLMARFHVIAGQEWGDRLDLTQFAREAGWSVLLGNKDGSRATPLLVGPMVKVRHKVTRVMLPAMNLGEGAGPSHTKQKCANGALLSLDGTVFGVVSTHLVASQQFNLREGAAKRHVRNLALTFTPRHFPWFILGDFNCTPEKPQLNDLYKSHWTNTAMKEKPLPTHGARSIDYVWWRKSRSVGYGRQRTHPTDSDHRALGAVFHVS